MADEPRRVSTRRAVLSYDQLGRLTKESGNQWPDLLIKDYQGIIQDFAFLADELDALEVRVEANELAIIALEYRVFEVIETTVSITIDEFKIVICKNTSLINITLKLSPIKGDEAHIKRQLAPVNVIGKVDGKTNKKINIKNYSMHLVFNGIDWSEI